jgi:hypothetical protein
VWVPSERFAEAGGVDEGEWGENEGFVNLVTRQEVSRGRDAVLVLDCTYCIALVYIRES